jgi:hydrogenase nickel incorporation protein HypB
VTFAKIVHNCNPSILPLLIKDGRGYMVHVQFDMDQCIRYTHQVNSDMQVPPVSAVQDEGLESWIHWLQE